VDPRAGLDNMEERKFLTLPGLDLRPLGLPARSQLLYRLLLTGLYSSCMQIANNAHNDFKPYFVLYGIIVDCAVLQAVSRRFPSADGSN
jgi:hypothetical protein